MNWDAIAAVAETIGAVAVVASLIYVATQMRQSNRIGIRETRSALIAHGAGISRLSLENPQVADLCVKLRAANSVLTPEEAHQAYDLASMWVYYLAQVNGSHEAGLLPDRVFEVYLGTFSRLLTRMPGLSPHFVTVLQETGIKPGDFAAHDFVFNLIGRSEKA